MQTVIQPSRRAVPSGLLSLTHPSKELFYRKRALLRRTVPAGSRSADHLEQIIGMDNHLIQYRESTFFMRVTGDSMRGLGIFDGDLLVVDRALPATHGRIVIAVVDGEFSVKQLLHTANGQVLRSAHPDAVDLHIGAAQDCAIWGVVDWNVSQF